MNYLPPGYALRVILLLMGIICASSVGIASAVEVQVTSRTMGDIYSHLRANWDDSDPIRRQRIHQLLGLNLFDLTSDKTNQVYFVSNLRIDADFGVSVAEQEQIEGLSQTDFALLYGYLNVHQWLGFLDIRLGRQYEIDAIDMVLYDGIRLRAYSPWYVGAEALAGLEATHRVGPTVSSHTLDGTPGGPLLLEGKYGEVEPRLVVGGGLFLHHLPYTQFDLSYRRIQTLGEGVDPEVLGKPGINQERFGVAASQRIMEGLFINAGASYDLFLGGVNELLAGIRYRPTFSLETEFKYHYLLPSFDADSIWNVFSWRPMDRTEQRVRIYGSEDFWVYGGAYQSFFRADDSVTEEDIDAVVEDLGFSMGSVLRIQPDSYVRTDLNTEFGYGGRQTFLDVGGGTTFRSGMFGLDGRLLMIFFEDEQQSRLNGTMLGAQVEGTWFFTKQGKLSLLVEEASSELQPHWLRVLAVLDFNFWM